MNKIKHNNKFIYIVEDDESIRELVIYTLEGVGYKVIGCSNATSFYKLIENDIPRLCILDIMLPVIGGMDILKYLKKSNTYKEVPIIMLTAKNNEMSKINALDSGADDYITKPFGIMELTARVRALLRRAEKNYESFIYKINNIVVNVDDMLVLVDDKKVELTNKEFALLKCFFENENKILSREKLLDLVWGYGYLGQTRTVDMHIKSLRKKLGCDIIETLRGIGYRIRK